MSSMIRGYGLPSEGAGSYNGYAGYGAYRGPGARRSMTPGLFRPIPDPELGDYRGFGDDPAPRTFQKPAEHVLTGLGLTIGSVQQPAAAGISMGIVAAAAVALFFLMKK